MLSIFIQPHDCLCFLKVVAKFREEVARDIQDSRFTVPRDLSNVKPLDCLIMVCLYVDMGLSENNIPNYSHLMGIMIIITIGYRGTLFSDISIFMS